MLLLSYFVRLDCQSPTLGPSALLALSGPSAPLNFRTMKTARKFLLLSLLSVVCYLAGGWMGYWFGMYKSVRGNFLLSDYKAPGIHQAAREIDTVAWQDGFEAGSVSALLNINNTIEAQRLKAFDIQKRVNTSRRMPDL
jgi:hypothetical protein